MVPRFSNSTSLAEGTSSLIDPGRATVVVLSRRIGLCYVVQKSTLVNEIYVTDTLHWYHFRTDDMLDQACASPRGQW